MPFKLTYGLDAYHQEEITATLNSLRRGLPHWHSVAALTEFGLTEGTPTEDEQYLLDQFTDLTKGALSGPNWALTKALRRLEQHFAARVKEAEERETQQDREEKNGP